MKSVLAVKTENQQKLENIAREVAKLKRRFGVLPEYMEQYLMKGHCPKCHQNFYVESRIGEMVCPHCTYKLHEEDDWDWGGLQFVFVKET